MLPTASVNRSGPPSVRLWGWDGAGGRGDAVQRAHEVRFAHIVEGRCPRHGTELERLEHCGWCSDCGHGWRARVATAEFLRGRLALFHEGEHLVGRVYHRDPRPDGWVKE
jgi:hypothetical protein